MIQVESRLNVADNSGAKELMCIRVLGGSGKKYAGLGDLIVAVVKDALPPSAARKGAGIAGVKKGERKPWSSGPARKRGDRMVPTLV